MIRAGMIVPIAPQWRASHEPPDFLYVVKADEEKGRVGITPLKWDEGSIRPINTVTTNMIEALDEVPGNESLGNPSVR